jgi:hypothetical protein
VSSLLPFTNWIKNQTDILFSHYFSQKVWFLVSSALENMNWEKASGRNFIKKNSKFITCAHENMAVNHIIND